MEVFVIQSHYEYGPSTWVASTADKAKIKAIALLREEVEVYVTEEYDDVAKEILDYLDADDFDSAHTEWQRWQIEDCNTDYLEAITIDTCDVDDFTI